MKKKMFAGYCLIFALCICSCTCKTQTAENPAVMKNRNYQVSNSTFGGLSPSTTSSDEYTIKDAKITP